MTDARTIAARKRLDAAIAEKQEAHAALAAAVNAEPEARLLAWRRYERAVLAVQAARSYTPRG